MKKKALEVMLSIIALTLTSVLYNQTFISKVLLGRRPHQTDDVLCLYHTHHQKSWTFATAFCLRK